jgi:hypothetical protein
MRKLASMLDKVATELQEKGLVALATELDSVSNALDKMASKDDRRGNFVFPPDSKDVSDKAGHYPIHDKKHAHSALSYAAAEANSSPNGRPSWSHTLTNKQVEARVRAAVKKEYPSIELDPEKDK